MASLIKGDASNWQPIYDTTNSLVYGSAADGYVEATNSNMIGGILAILSTAPFFLAGFETIPQA